MTLPVAFTPEAAARVYNAVQLVERGNRDQKPLTFRRVLDQGSVTRTSVSVHMATYTGAWSLNSSKVVTLYQSTSTVSTFAVTNLVMPVPDAPSGGSGVCVIARDRGTWFLVNVQMSEENMIQSVSLQPTKLEFGRRKVVSVSGTQTTSAISITECDNEAASAEQLNWFFG